MLDVVDFIKDKGGDPNVIKESQKRRHAPEEAVDEVISLWKDHRTGAPPVCCNRCRRDDTQADPEAAKYAAQQIGDEINRVQKEIGLKKKVWNGYLGKTRFRVRLRPLLTG